jgi:RimJ/RimL family protein N-acetyltransferase
MNAADIPPMRSLPTALCVLEPQVVAHAAEMFVVLGDPAIYQYENGPPSSAAWLAERFARLESRASADGSEAWLNWVVRHPDGALAGYVQATVSAGVAYVAYVLASRFWGRGLGRCAVAAMLAELACTYRVHSFRAVLKARNERSLALLRHLGFSPATPAQIEAAGAAPDELVMQRDSVGVDNCS